MVDNSGYGQQTPWDSSSEFGVASFIIRQYMARMATMKLVRVQAVSGGGTAAAPGTVDVLPLVNQVDGMGNATPHSTVYGVPWFRSQAGSSAFICDPKVDDVGYVVVSDRDISAVKSTGKAANPGSFRKFDIADGVYVGGLLGEAPTQFVALTDARIDIVSPNEIRATVGSGHVTLTPTAIVLAFGTNNITIDGTGIHFNGPTIFNGLASGFSGTVDFGSNNITTTGTINGNTVTSAGKILATHIHSGVTTGSGNSGAPV